MLRSEVPNGPRLVQGPGAALVLIKAPYQKSTGQARAVLARAMHELKILRLSAGLARTRELLKRVSVFNTMPLI